MKRFIWILSVLAVGSLLAAEWPNGPAKTHAFLTVIIANDTKQNVHEAGVYFDQYPCRSGVVGAGVSKGYLGWRQPVTTNAIVRWRDSRGTNNEQTVSLVGVYDPKMDGDLTFTIRATNVTVEFKKITRQ